MECAMSWYNEAICLIVDFFSQIHKLLSKVTFRIFLLLFSVCFFSFHFLSFSFLIYSALFCFFPFLSFFVFQQKETIYGKKDYVTYSRHSIYKYTE